MKRDSEAATSSAAAATDQDDESSSDTSTAQISEVVDAARKRKVDRPSETGAAFMFPRDSSASEVATAKKRKRNGEKDRNMMRKKTKIRDKELGED